VSEPAQATADILDILIGQHPGLLHVDELARMYGRASVEPDSARRIVDDAISELLASGLVHRLDRFVFVTRAALCARELAP
jgi:hypothetical protein